MEDKSKNNMQTILQILQIVVISIGLAGVFVRLGEYQANQQFHSVQLKELKQIVESLTRSQIEFASTDASLKEKINALRDRIDRIDRVSFQP